MGRAQQADDVVADRLHRFAGIVAWLRGIPLREVETAYARGSPDEPMLSRLRGAVDRSADMIFPVLAVLRVAIPDQVTRLQDIGSTLRARLEIGGDAVASQIHRLRLGLSRHECLALVMLGIDSEA